MRARAVLRDDSGRSLADAVRGGARAVSIARRVLPPVRDERAELVKIGGENFTYNISSDVAAAAAAQRTFGGARCSSFAIAIQHIPSVCRPVCHVRSRVQPSVDDRRRLLHAVAVRHEMPRNVLRTSHGRYTMYIIIYACTRIVFNNI